MHSLVHSLQRERVHDRGRVCTHSRGALSMWASQRTPHHHSTLAVILCTPVYSHCTRFSPGVPEPDRICKPWCVVCDHGYMLVRHPNSQGLSEGGPKLQPGSPQESQSQTGSVSLVVLCDALVLMKKRNPESKPLHVALVC